MSRILLLFLAVFLPMGIFIFMKSNQQERQLVIPPGIELTDSERKGEIIFAKKGCNVCHSILGTKGGSGPVLDHVTSQKSEEDLQKWLENPKLVNKAARMPNLKLKTDEITSLIAFLKWVNMVNETLEESK